MRKSVNSRKESHPAGRAKPDPGIVHAFEKRLLMSLRRLLEAMFDDADDTLFGMAEEAGDNRRQALHFDTMRILRTERPRIIEYFSQGLQASLREEQPAAAEPPAAPDASASDPQNMQLQDMDSLEKSIAVSNMTARALQLCSLQFSDLTRRLEWLRSAVELPIDAAAASPGNVCAQFQSGMDEAELDIETQLLVYKLFELIVVTGLNKVYTQLNALLENGGVPKPARTIRRQPSAEAKRADAEHITATGEKIASGSGGKQTAPATRDAGDAASAAPPPSVRHARMITALNTLQHRVAGIEDDTLLTQDWVGAQLRGALQAAREANHNHQLPKDQTRLFDLLTTLFEDLLTDTSLSTPVKLLLARLQIPIVKIAMVNPDFFRRHTHPARELLSEIARLGKLIPDAQSALFAQVKHVVEQLLREFDQDLRQVEQTVLKLREISICANRSDLSPDAAQRRAHNEDATNQAKEAVMRELSFLARGKILPDEIKQFVVNAWGPVMGLQFAKHGPDSPQWRGSSQLLAAVVQSVQPEQNDAAQRMNLLQRLRRELPTHGVDPNIIDESLARLESFYLANGGHPAAPHTGTAPIEHRLRSLLNSTLQPNAWFQMQTRTNATAGQWLKLCVLDQDTDPSHELRFANHQGEILFRRSVPEIARDLCSARVRPIFTSDQAFHKLQADLNFALHPPRGGVESMLGPSLRFPIEL